MDRRQLIIGLISLVAAPAIVRSGFLMPVKAERLHYPDLGRFALKGYDPWASEGLSSNAYWEAYWYVDQLSDADHKALDGMLVAFEITE